MLQLWHFSLRHRLLLDGHSWLDSVLYLNLWSVSQGVLQPLLGSNVVPLTDIDGIEALASLLALFEILDNVNPLVHSRGREDVLLPKVRGVHGGAQGKLGSVQRLSKTIRSHFGLICLILLLGCIVVLLNLLYFWLKSLSGGLPSVVNTGARVIWWMLNGHIHELLVSALTSFVN